MMQFEKPTDGDYQSVRHYINNSRPLVKEECRPFCNKADMVSLKPRREPNWLEASLGRLLGHVDSSLTRVSSSCIRCVNVIKLRLTLESLRAQGSLICSQTLQTHRIKSS